MRILLALALLAPGAFAQPVVLWASDPIRPGETALVFGEGFETTKSIEVIRLEDGDPGLPPECPTVLARGEAITVEPLQPRPHSVKFTIPESSKPGIYACRISTAQGATVAVLNRPTLNWLLGDAGPEATPGGSLRLFGRCLAPRAWDGTIHILLRGAKRDTWIPLAQKVNPALVEYRMGSASHITAWSVKTRLPAGISSGTCKVYVHNGSGGIGGWSAPLELVVRKPEPWPSTVFNVRDFGAKGTGGSDDTLAVQAALDKARESGGGVVYFPRGRYQLTTGIEVPPRTTLKGEGRELVAILWPDLPEPPEFLVFGKKSFAVEGLTFHCSNYTHFLGNDVSDPEAGDVHVRRICVRADLYRGHLTPEQVAERFAASLKRSTGGGDTLHLGGSNIEVVDSDLYGSGRCLFLLRGRGVRIQGNSLYNGRWGWYCISGADGVVLEENDIIGADLMATGGGLNCLYGVTWAQNVFYARNGLSLMHGWDREAMTSDAGGGVYCGPLASATPTSVTLGGEPKWDSRDWRGAAVFILDGKGMGQYRRIARWDARLIEVDEPWTILPDATSTVSVTMLQRNYQFIGNHFADAGIAIQLYGMAIGHVMAGNRSTRTGGYHNFGMNYHGIQPSWFNQWLDNTVEEGNVYRGGHDNHLLAGPAHLGVFAFPPSAEWNHPLTLCTIVRGNRLASNAQIAIGGSDPNNPALRAPLVQEVVVEGNSVAKSDVGISLRRAAEGVLLRNNRFSDVADPVLTDDEIERRAAERRAKLLNLQEPVAWWSFDHVTGLVVPDDSGHGFTARLEGTVRFEPGVRGQAAVFDGAGDLRVGQGDLLHLARFTVAAWIKPQTVAGRQGILAKRDRHAAAPFVLSVWDGAIEFEACEADDRKWSFNFRSPQLVKAGEWQHVAAVVEEGKGVTLYLDGKPIATRENAAKLAQNDLDLWIGKEAWGGDNRDPQIPGGFKGAIDDVKLWSRALTEDEIRREAERE